MMQRNIRKHIKSAVLLAALALSGVQVQAQVDPHFSQFYANPLWLNPGMAGVIDGDYRVTAIYRNQWSNVLSPFVTSGVSADMSTSKNINFGVNFLTQKAGDAGYKYTTGYATISYGGLRFGPENYQQITIGIQGGLLSRKFDPSKFQFGDQWNPITGYNPGATSADVVARTSSSVLDLGAGMSYLDGTPDKQVNFFGGIGVFHLTKPEDPFLNKTGAVLPMRISVHGGASIQATDNFTVRPNALYLRQGTAEEIMLGLNGELTANENVSVILGLNYRLKDAISPYMGITFLNFSVGAAYDVNTSDLGKSVSGTNSFELSLTYTGRKKEKLRYLSCPRF